MCLRYESRHSHMEDAVQSPVSPSVHVTLRVTGDDCKVTRAAEWPIRHVLFRVPLGYFSIFFGANMDQLNSEPHSSYKGFTTKNCYYFLFSDQVSLSCPNWPETCDFLASTSWAAGRTDFCHQPHPHCHIVMKWMPLKSLGPRQLCYQNACNMLYWLLSLFQIHTSF